MDLNFTPEERAFRAEMRQFFREDIPADIRAKAGRGEHVSKDDLVAVQRAMNARGIAVPHWPVAYGGQDWTAGSKLHLAGRDAEQLRPGAAGVQYVHGRPGHRAVRDGGTEAALPAGDRKPGHLVVPGFLRTRRRVRPGIAAHHGAARGRRVGDRRPEDMDHAGAARRLDLRAVPHGLHVKKQEGISFILADMRTPGITVRPIQTIDGGVEVNEVWFDQVRVPYGNLVGQENRGWDCAKFLLGNERTGIARVGVSKARLIRLRELAALERVGDHRVIDDPRFREKLTAVEIELKALEMTQLRVVAEDRHLPKGVPNPKSSILKLRGSEIQQRTTELLMEVVGPYAMPYRHEVEAEGDNDPMSIGPDYAAEAAPTYFNWRKVSIYGGSNEIQRNIVAKAILDSEWTST